MRRILFRLLWIASVPKRFFFDTFDGENEIRDELGVECSSLEELEDAAVAALPDMAHDELPDGLSRTMWVRVRDPDHRPVFEAELVFNGRWFGPRGTIEALFED